MKATKRGIARTCRTEVTVEAPVEAVWQVIADVTRTGEWSHECRQAAWLHGATQAAPGVRFRGRNRSGWLRWSRVCEVIAVQAPRELAWRTLPTPLLPDSTQWRITLEPVDGATQIVQTYQLTRCPGWYEWVVARINPTHIDRSGALADDLRRLGAIAAGDAPSSRRGDRWQRPTAWESGPGESEAQAVTWHQGAQLGTRPGKPVATTRTVTQSSPQAILARDHPSGRPSCPSTTPSTTA